MTNNSSVGKAYIKEVVTTHKYPKEHQTSSFYIKDLDDDTTIAMFAYKAGVGEWFKHNRHRYTLIDKE